MKYEKMNIEEFVQATHTFRLGDKVGTTSVLMPRRMPPM